MYRVMPVDKSVERLEWCLRIILVGLHSGFAGYYLFFFKVAQPNGEFLVLYNYIPLLSLAWGLIGLILVAYKPRHLVNGYWILVSSTTVVSAFIIMQIAHKLTVSNLPYVSEVICGCGGWPFGQ